MFFGNLFLFTPLSLLMPISFASLRTSHILLLSAFFLSLFAESLQYLFKVGLLDVDDIILNVAGVALGWLLGVQMDEGNGLGTSRFFYLRFRLFKEI
ncbi:MAG: VanZ family protein [Bacteroidota bacterium]